MTAPSIPPDAVIRVSRGNFDQSRFAEVEQMTRDTGDYLIPAITQLDWSDRLLRRRFAEWVDRSRQPLANQRPRGPDGPPHGDDHRRPP